MHELVGDELRAAIAPLLPSHPPRPEGGNARKSNRTALCGIIDVLKNSIQWQMLSAEPGCGGGSTCWRAAGV